MKIAKNTVVTVNYKLSDAQNNLIEEGVQPMVYLHGGYENTLPKIEEHLDGKVLLVDSAALPKKTRPAIEWRGNIGHVSVDGEAVEVKVTPGEKALFSLRDAGE